MSRVAPSAFPELRRVFSGYLHEDSLVETGTPEAALQVFRADASPDERRRFQREVKRFLAQTSALNLDDLRDLVYQLGCRWIPSSREALVELLREAAELREPPSQ